MPWSPGPSRLKAGSRLGIPRSRHPGYCISPQAEQGPWTVRAAGLLSTDKTPGGGPRSFGVVALEVGERRPHAAVGGGRVCEPEFLEYVLDVRAYRVRAQHEPLGNAPVRQAFGNEFQ